MKQLKLTFLLTVFMSMVGAKASAYDIAVANDDGVTIYYNYINEGKELGVVKSTSYDDKYSGNITIPEDVVYMGRKRKVTSILGSAFAECSHLTSVTIPNSVTSIYGYAFAECSSLISVTIPQSVTTVGKEAFKNCKNLGMVDIMVTDYSAFCNNKVIFALDYYGNDTGLDTHSHFRLIDKEGNEIQEYIIPEDVTSIGYYAFRECIGLTSITIPNSVTSIDGWAFFGCRSLTSIEIPNSVTSIGECAFYGCSGLKKVIISDIAAWMNITFDTDSSPLLYAHHLYYTDGTEITQLEIPYGITEIKYGTFSGWSALTSVTIPNSVTSIGSWAFYGCIGLTSITIPDKVTSIGSSAFYYCSGLTSVAIPNSVTSIEFRTFCDCRGLTSVTIPNSVTNIGEEAFYECGGLTSVTIPNSVTSIDDNAFKYCDNLRSIVSLIEEPFTIYGKNSNKRVFDVDVYNNISLYVPTGTTWKYRYVGGWGDFVWIEEGYPKFNVHYLVDNKRYKLYEYDYGESITPEAEPTKEGYTFSGWSEIPETMPAHDVTVTGTFNVNQYTITYMIDDEVYQTESVDYGSTITPPSAPEREGYTFEWTDVPETMPANDVTVTGTFIVNQYTITYMIDNEVYQTESVDYGSTITLPDAPERDGYTFEWTDVPETMPASDITIVGSYTSGINAIKADDEDVKWYTLEGKQIEQPRKGLNIVRMSNGKTKKVLVK